MNKFFFLIFNIISCAIVAQTPQEQREEVMEPVNLLFTGMNQGDSAMVHSAFMKRVSMTTISKNKEGKPVIGQQNSLDGFLKAVGTPHDQAWSEPMWDAQIQIDGNMAQVWTKYAFYLGKTFSHCGVDAFQLFKGEDGKWRLFSLADTRQKDGCVIPPAVSILFK